MKGFENLRRSRHVGNFKLLFRRRKAIEVGQMTHWELMDLLFERGWSCKAIVARQKVDAISLSPGVDPVASFYYNSQLEISKSYLHVLCQAKALADIGHTVIQRKQTVEYYNALLRTLTPDEVLPMLVDDSQASELLAIEDAKPEESDEAAQEAHCCSRKKANTMTTMASQRSQHLDRSQQDKRSLRFPAMVTLRDDSDLSRFEFKEPKKNDWLGIEMDRAMSISSRRR